MEASTTCLQDLPHHVRDSMLQQAFQQLDQRHQFGVVTLVCRLWHGLALSISHSIDVSIPTRAAAEPLRSWVAEHGHGLKSMTIVVNNNPDVPGEASEAAATAAVVVDSLSAAPSLSSLKISLHRSLLPTMHRELNVDLSSFTSLTSLQLIGWELSSSSIASLLSLTQLSSLDLSSSTFVTGVDGPQELMQHISTSLVQITRLELNDTCIRTGDQYPSMFSLEDLAPLCSLQHLRKVGSLMLQCVDLSSMSKLPITHIRIPWFSSNTHDVQLAAWVRNSGQSLESAIIFGCGNPGRPPPKRSVEAATCAPQLRTLQMMSVSLCVAELALLMQLSSLELAVCDFRDADLCKSLVMPNLRSLRLVLVSGEQEVYGCMHFLEADLPQLTELRVSDRRAAAMAEAALKDRIVGTSQQQQQRRNGPDEWVYTLLPAGPPGREEV